jgi:hypothetical protein
MSRRSGETGRRTRDEEILRVKARGKRQEAGRI